MDKSPADRKRRSVTISPLVICAMFLTSFIVGFFIIPGRTTDEKLTHSMIVLYGFLLALCVIGLPLAMWSMRAKKQR